MTRFAVLGSFLALAACGATPPGDPAGVDAGDDPIVGDVPLEVDVLPPTTLYGAVPISGLGPAGGTLIYDVPARGQFSANLGADGSFCVDVPLKPGETNTIRFQAIDAEGAYSGVAVATIAQSGEPPKPPDPEVDNGVRNIGLGVTVFKNDVGVAAGALDMLGDGSKSAHVQLDDGWGAWTWNYLAIKLDERASIYSVKITTTDDCPMEKFEWFLSNLDAPVNGPDTDEAEWTFQNAINRKASEHLLWPSLAEPTAQWIGIDFESADCAGSFLDRGHHRIKEIEVYTRDAAPGEAEEPPENPNPTCASGGSVD